MNSIMWKGKRLGAILAIGLTALLVVSACAPAPTAPEEKVLQVGGMRSLTGPAAADDAPSVYAYMDYIKYFNEQEGIPGVTVEYLWRDTALTMARCASAYDAFKALGIGIMTANDTTFQTAYQERMERDKIVFMTGATASDVVYPPHWEYFRSATFCEQFAVLAEYLMENWQEARPPKIALFVGESAWGREPEIAKSYVENLGFEVLPSEVIPYAIVDASANLLRVSHAGADFVFIQGLEIQMIPVLKDAESLELGDIQFAGAWPAVTEKTIGTVGDFMEGFLLPTCFPLLTAADVRGIKLMHDLQMKYRGKSDPNWNYLSGIIESAIICEALRRAVENVGYENVDGTAIKEAFDSIKDFDVYGLATITYTADDHRGWTKVAICEVRGGEKVRLTDWREAPSIPIQK